MITPSARIGLFTIVLAIGTLAACGSTRSSSSSGNSRQADIDAVMAQVNGSGGVVTKTQDLCIAQHAVPNLSSKGLAAARKGSSDLSGLSMSDQQAIFDGLSACVKTADLSKSLEKALESGSNKVDAATAKCFIAKVQQEFPKSGDLMKAMNSGTSTKVTQMMTGCMMGGTTTTG